MEKVSFYRDEKIIKNAENAFKYHKNEISRRIPGADIQHVGSTAVPGSVTKGDLDIQVRVDSTRFDDAVEILSEMYDLNTGSVSTSEFRAFEDREAYPPLGIQLTVIGSEFDFFWKIRDILLQNPDLKKEYNDLKLKYEGSDMEVYRNAKEKFFEKILQNSDRSPQY